jgi:hypothetical protein
MAKEAVRVPTMAGSRYRGSSPTGLAPLTMIASVVVN